MKLGLMERFRAIVGRPQLALETLYAELRRCRDYCDGRPTVIHYTAEELSVERPAHQRRCRAAHLSRGLRRVRHAMLAHPTRSQRGHEHLRADPLSPAWSSAQSPQFARTVTTKADVAVTITWDGPARRGAQVGSGAGAKRVAVESTAAVGMTGRV